MDNERQSKQRMEIAIFRHGVISDFVNGSNWDPRERGEAIREKCKRKWVIPYSSKTSISETTVYRWIRAYEGYNGKRNRLESLMPEARCDQSRSRAMDSETCAALVEFRKQHPRLSIKELIREMKVLKRVSPGIPLTQSTVYRFLKQNGLMDAKQSGVVDRRKFEATGPNELWQSDVMHGPRVLDSGKKRKTYLIAIIDDHSRLIPFARFYLSEGQENYLDALYHALARRGLPRKLYVDNGSAFRSQKLHQVTASLNIALIHAQPYTPQGKGKIERVFKTIRSSFLLEDTPDTLDELNERFRSWLEGYHTRIHSSTSETPYDRFTRNLTDPRLAPGDLKQYFRTSLRRSVAMDRSVTISGRLFQAPTALIGKRIEVVFHDSNPTEVEAVLNGKSYGMLSLLSVSDNYRAKRDREGVTEIRIQSNQSSYTSGQLFNDNGVDHD